MQGLYALGQDIGLALAWILPALCYISGGSFIAGGIWGIFQRSSMANGFLSKGFVPELMIAAGATLLSFPEFLTAGSSTLGLTASAAMGGTTQEVSFSAQSLTTAASSGPAGVLTDILNEFSAYFACYGALIVYFAIVRQVGRAKGANNSSLAVNLIMMIAGFLVMNVDVLAPAILQELQLTS